MSAQTPAFAHARGSITYRGDPISDADAHWYRAMYRDELQAAFAVGSHADPIYEAARSLYLEIVNAQEAQRQHRIEAERRLAVLDRQYGRAS